MKLFIYILTIYLSGLTFMPLAGLFSSCSDSCSSSATEMVESTCHQQSDSTKDCCKKDTGCDGDCCALCICCHAGSMFLFTEPIEVEDVILNITATKRSVFSFQSLYPQSYSWGILHPPQVG